MASYFILLFQFLSLSFWIGGSIVLLMIVTPIASQALPSSVDASEVVAAYFKKFNSFFLLNAALLGLTLYFQIAFLSHGVALKLRFAITFVSMATLIGAYQRFALVPSIDRIRSSLMNTAGGPESGQGAKLRSLQGRSIFFFFVNLFLGVAVVITLLLPFR